MTDDSTTKRLPTSRSELYALLDVAAETKRKLAAKERPHQLNQLIAHLLDHPGFDWERDGQACLKEHNPEFLEKPRLPSILPMNDDLVDGLRYLKALDAERAASGRFAAENDEAGDDDSIIVDDMSAPRTSQSARKKSKKKRKQARKARRLSRR
jgi:hypothetical protein